MSLETMFCKIYKERKSAVTERSKSVVLLMANLVRRVDASSYFHSTVDPGRMGFGGQAFFIFENGYCSVCLKRHTLRLVTNF
jgi:hypothetical protein